MATVNEKALIKAIKATTKKERLVWQLRDNTNYITNGFWLYKTNNLAPNVLAELIKLFGRVVGEGECYNYQHGSAQESHADCTRIITGPTDFPVVGVDTKISFQLDNNYVRLFKNKEAGTLTAIDVRYFELLDEPSEIKMQSQNDVILFDDTLLIAPVMPRNISNWKDKLTEILN